MHPMPPMPPAPLMDPMNPKDTERLKRDEAKRLATDTISRLIDEHPPEFIEYLMEQLFKLGGGEDDSMMPPLPYETISTAGPKGFPGPMPTRPDPHLSNISQVIKRG